MPITIVTGSCGLIGSEAVKFFCQKGHKVIGIDNDMRAYFFGPEASTQGNQKILESHPDYKHYGIDIRDQAAVNKIFSEYNKDISLVIHTAAQPSHDWAARDPLCDFTVNANGTLVMLEAARKYCPATVFIFTSTNKVYGDLPNSLPLVEEPTRWEIEKGHPFYEGIDETMSIDQSKHSLFGASKAAADLLVQEYGRYFGMKTGVFRGGCLTGPAHCGVELHGFLFYLAKCVAVGKPYTVYGYKGKQVRDNIHSYDLVNAFYHFYLKPRCGEVYNIGGSRHANISMKEAVSYFEKIFKKKAGVAYSDQNRQGDHIWYISNVNKFKSHYPKWDYVYDINRIMDEICEKGDFS